MSESQNIRNTNSVPPTSIPNPAAKVKTGFSETVIPNNRHEVTGPQKPNVKLCPDISNIGNSINNKKYFIPSQFPNLTKKTPIVYLKKTQVPRGGRKSYKLIKKRKRKISRRK